MPPISVNGSTGARNVRSPVRACSSMTSTSSSSSPVAPCSDADTHREPDELEDRERRGEAEDAGGEQALKLRLELEPAAEPGAEEVRVAEERDGERAPEAAAEMDRDRPCRVVEAGADQRALDAEAEPAGDAADDERR